MSQIGRDLGSEWIVPWNRRQGFQITLRSFLLAVGMEQSICLVLCGSRGFQFCWCLQLFCFFTQYFWNMFQSGQDKVVRNQAQPDRWEERFPKASEGHLGEKKKNLLSDLSYKEESLSNSCGLLVTLIPVQGKVLPLELQLLGICTDVNLGQCAHKLALISCLSSKNRNILCFLQITWKWKILLSRLLIAELPSCDEQLWDLPFWGARCGAPEQGLKGSERFSSDNQAVCFKPLKMQALSFLGKSWPWGFTKPQPIDFVWFLRYSGAVWWISFLVLFTCKY